MKRDRESTDFDSTAAAYDAWYETPLGRLVDRLEKEAVFALLEARPGDRALDVSCGTGNYALTLAQQGFRVVGLDRSEPMLRTAQAKARRAGVAIPLVRADGSALPLRASTFDVVTVILGLEFTADAGQTLEEVRRILKPGARLVVAILNRAALWTLWRRLKRWLVRSLWRDATFFTAEDLRGLLEARGFADLRWRGAVHFLPLCRTRGVAWLARWETLAARWAPGRATFLAVAARRP